jgi:putative ABC transport system ATP-binding protein
VNGPVLEARGLRRSFRRGPEVVHAVEGADLALEPGEVVALVGPSGSGKSTLLSLLAGWDRPEAGEILWDGAPARPADRAWRELAMVPQNLGLTEELTVLENIELPVRLAPGEPQVSAESLLDEFGLAELAGRLPSEISIGEQQRVAVARALLLAPIVLLADEPTGHQDAEMAERVMSRLRSTAARGTACLVATHSPEAVAFAHRVLGIRDGRVPEAHADILRP